MRPWRWPHWFYLELLVIVIRCCFTARLEYSTTSSQVAVVCTFAREDETGNVYKITSAVQANMKLTRSNFTARMEVLLPTARFFVTINYIMVVINIFYRILNNLESHWTFKTHTRTWRILLSFHTFQVLWIQDLVVLWWNILSTSTHLDVMFAVKYLVSWHAKKCLFDSA